MLNFERCLFRPIAEQDLELILKWRNAEHISKNMFSDHNITWEEHLEWFNKISKGSNSKHYIFVYNGRQLGVANFTNISDADSRCFWGFYIGAADAPKKSGLAMGYFALNFIFNEVGMAKLCSEVFAFNMSSINYHKKLGFSEEGYFKQHVKKRGKFEDLVFFAQFKERWEQQISDISEQCFEGDISKCRIL